MMNNIININTCEELKTIVEERYFLGDDEKIGPRLNVYQNQLFDEGKLELLRHADYNTILEMRKRILLNHITLTPLCIPQIKTYILKEKGEK